MNHLKKRNDYFDNVKGFLIFTVVLGHIFESIKDNSIDGGVFNSHGLLVFIYLFHMPLFTFISGYFSKRSSRSAGDKVINMFKIYFLAQVGYIIFYKYIVGDVDTYYRFFQPSWSLWYLLSLTFWYIISDYIKPSKKLLIGSIIVALVLGFDSSLNSYFSIVRTFVFLPYFIAGYLVDDNFVCKIRSYRKYFTFATMVIIFAIILWGDLISIDALYEYSCYDYTEYGKGMFFIRLFHYGAAFITGGAILGWVTSKRGIFTEIGRRSLVVYLVHTAVIKVVFMFMPPINTKLLGYLSIVIVFGVILAINEVYSNIISFIKIGKIEKLKERLS